MRTFIIPLLMKQNVNFCLIRNELTLVTRDTFKNIFQHLTTELIRALGWNGIKEMIWRSDIKDFKATKYFLKPGPTSLAKKVDISVRTVIPEI